MSAVLVTGAGGFVCSNVIHVLAKLGYHVVAVDRAFDADLRLRWANQPVEIIESDVLPNIAVDYLIHGAAITASPEDRGETPEANFRANIDPLLAALDWTAARSLKRGIFISSGGVFSQNTGALALTESTPAIPYGLYAVAKTTMEDIVTTLNGLYNRPLVSIRLSNIYGPFERSRPTRVRTSLVNRLLHEALTEQRVTVPADAPQRDWTFAPDLGHAFHALLQAPLLNHSLYHVTSGATITPLAIAQAIQTLLPNVAIIHDTTPQPQRAGWLSSQFWSDDVGFTNWTPFRDGLKQVLDWHMERIS